jgi:hypothetical protein
LLCAIFGLAMFFSTPTFGASDSAVHLATAWYDVHHIVPSATSYRWLENSNTPLKPCPLSLGKLNETLLQAARLPSIRVTGPVGLLGNRSPKAAQRLLALAIGHFQALEAP